jgi:serine protease
MSDIAAAIYWAAGAPVPGSPTNANPADVISLSLGGGGACSATEQNAINFAISRGAVVTVAAGNENRDAANSSPGNCAGVITVAATDSSGKRASFSNFGSYVEISAPGVGIYSTVNTGTTTPSGSSYESWSGTSMATPHVAGVVALMLSRDPSLTPAQVLQRIQSTATAFGGGFCDSNATKTCGSGIINAGLAVQ